MADQSNSDDGGRGPSQREKIVTAVIDSGVRFWRDADGEGYATVPSENGSFAQYVVKSRRFRQVTRMIYGAAFETASGHPASANDAAVKEAISAFEAMALREVEKAPDVRVLKDAGGIWLDLGDSTGTLIRITASGWRPVTGADVPLIRPDGMRPLPLPLPDPGALGNLRALLNIGPATDDAADMAFRLIVAWLISCLWPTGPYAILAVDGEQGSGKSTACRILRKLVDPNKANGRAPPRNEDDMIIAGTNGRVVAYDNISAIKPELADGLCRLATGTGLGKRALFSNGEEFISSISRAILLNGIPSLLDRGDMADRSIAITLPTIPDADRKTEADVWKVFDRAAPGILALLLDGVVTALRNLDAVAALKLRLPRMADFALLACAAAPAFGWTDGQMVKALEQNRKDAAAAVRDADPICDAVRSLVPKPGRTWKGSASALLTEVTAAVSLDAARDRAFPKNAANMAKHMRRLAPMLRPEGIHIDTLRSNKTREISIEHQFQGSENLLSPLSPPSPTSENSHKSVTVLVTVNSSPSLPVTAPVTEKPQISAVGDGGDSGDSKFHASDNKQPSAEPSGTEAPAGSIQHQHVPAQVEEIEDALAGSDLAEAGDEPDHQDGGVTAESDDEWELEI